MGVVRRKPASIIALTYNGIITINKTIPTPSRREIAGLQFSLGSLVRFFTSKNPARNQRNSTNSQGMKETPKVLGKFRSGNPVIRKL